MSLNYPDTKNPFFADEDDNVGFSNQSRALGGGGHRYTGFDDVPDDEFAKPVPTKAEQLQTMKEESINRQLDSTQRALASIYDSERMGVATAEELLHQGEQLDNIESKTDNINQDMKTSQRHLTSIKSVFGGIKNWWGGKKQPEATTPQPASYREESRLRTAVDSHQSTQPHPAMRIRSEDVHGFYDNEDSSARPDAYSGTYQQQQKATSGMSEYDKRFNQNLDMMSDGMSRLKGLAMGLGDEIEAQSEQIDRINTKVGSANVTIEDQNKQMRGILGYKGK